VTSGTLVTLAPAAAAPEEFAATARDCQAVGAAVAALPPLDRGAARETVAALREETDLLVQAAEPGLGADLVAIPLDAPGPALDELVAAVLAGGGAPVYEVGTPAQLDALADLLDRPAGAPVHVSLVLGRPGGLPGTLAAVARCLESLPPGVVWSATGSGVTALPVLLAALSGGGHVRAGTADEPVPGDPGRADLQLVARASGLARIAQRPPLSAGAARGLLFGPSPALLAPRPAPHPTSVEIR
jgi:3-keto-5-aminohexanoate cleavage enzyme